LFSAKLAIFQHYRGKNKLHFDEMMMSVLYLTNMLNCMLIKLTHWNGQTCWSTWKHYPDS